MFKSLNAWKWLLVYSAASLTVLQFIPIYFTYQAARVNFYFVVYVLLLISSIICLRAFVNHSGRSLLSKTFVCISLVLFFAACGFIVLGKVLVIWVHAGTIYQSKANPDVKIISRYMDAGATDSGPSPEDYEIVLSRPLTPYFRIETKVDTIKINTSEWVRKR